MLQSPNAHVHVRPHLQTQSHPQARPVSSGAWMSFLHFSHATMPDPHLH